MIHVLQISLQLIAVQEIILSLMNNYTFSVVATNSVGSGEAGVVMITTPGQVTYIYITTYITQVLN